MIVAFAIIDFISPHDFDVLVLYLAPIGLVTWLGAPASRWRIPLLAFVSWVILDLYDGDEHRWWVTAAEYVEKVVILGGAAYLFSYLKRILIVQARLNRSLKDRVRIIEQLAAGVAHEVRNPLGTVLNGVEYLERHERSAQERALIVDMRGAVNRAEMIVKDLLNFSAPMRLQIERAQIGELVATSTQEARRRADAANVALRIGSVPSAEVRVDTHRIIQVIANLLHNGIDASKSGGVVTVSVRVAQAGADASGELDNAARFVIIDIDDAGPGIPEDRIEHVFEPFFTTKAPDAGTGLGLAVSRRIVDEHGGLLRLSNRADGGLRATVILPIGD